MFFNIYTHSVAWAVKDKKFAKANINKHSFEAEFDRTMQNVNYSETNGILVGPEISRIFAEIILQKVDRNIADHLAQNGLVHNEHYAIRRYVNDYYVFSTTEDNLDRIKNIIKRELESFKLFLNEGKSLTFERPFVSNITLARHEVATIIYSLEQKFNVSAGELQQSGGRLANEVRAVTNSLRMIVRKYRVEFSNISGWVLGAIRRLIGKIATIIGEIAIDLRIESTEVVVALLQLVFYVCRMDLRVRTTYITCQIAAAIKTKSDTFGPVVTEYLVSVVHQELSLALEVGSKAVDPSIQDPIEILNLLICGAFYVGKEFVSDLKIRKILQMIAVGKGTNILTSPISNERITYFRYITAKFCYLSNKEAFKEELTNLNATVLALLSARANEIERDTELTLLLCDYLSAPDVSPRSKREAYIRFFGGNLSNTDAAKIGELVAFTDWRGMRIKHLLRRRELRPIY